MKILVIIGAGGHSDVIKDILDTKKYNKIKTIKFNIDKNESKNSIYIKKLFKNDPEADFYFVIGIGFNFYRKKISEFLNKNFKGLFKWESIVSNNAIISKKIKIGKGTVIMPGVVINAGTKIGNHCIINTSSSIDHDNFISNFVSIAPGVNTSGGVKIGEASHIGINSSIKQKVSIGKNVIIGAMTFVNQNCKNNLMIYGTPMRIIKKRKISDNYL
tara:strand:+ start:134 stop:781 length:648 start_codon:yes stop_codon:yes gene_type:complete